MQRQGLRNLADLQDLGQDGLESLFKKLARPAPQANGDPTPPFVVPALSELKLKVGAKAVDYYESIGVTPDTAAMQWSVLKLFSREWSVIESEGKQDNSSPPKMGKNMDPSKWAESFKLFLNENRTTRGAAYAHLIRDLGVPATIPALEAGKPYAPEHGSCSKALEMLISHADPLNKNENQQLYKWIEESLRGTPYHATISSCSKDRDGRTAFRTFMSNHCGKAYWEGQVTTSENLIKERQYTGTGSLTFEIYSNTHRRCHMVQKEAANHVPHSCMEERTRVKKLIEGITSKDPKILAAIATVEKDEQGMAIDFERAVAFIKPSCPVASTKKRSREAAFGEISGAEAGGHAKLGPKTGIPLRWYANEEFQKLSKDEKAEVRAHNATKPAPKAQTPGKKGKRQKQMSGKGLRGVIASVLKQQAKKQTEEETQLNEIASVLTQVMSSQPSNSSNGGGENKGNTVGSVDGKVEEAAKVAALKLQTIMKGSKKSKSS